MSDGELLESGMPQVAVPSSVSGVVTGVELSSSTSPQRTYYVWKDPPQTHLSGYNPSYPENTSSPVRHASYASQVGYYLQQQQPIQLQSGGPRTTPSGYPGMKKILIELLTCFSFKRVQNLDKI